MTDPTAAKAAIAAVKAAEKKYAAAEKKSSGMRDKYLEAQAATNRAARELAHARTNPDLYDDDPTTVVSPGQNLTGTTPESAEYVFHPVEKPVPISPEVVEAIKSGARVTHESARGARAGTAYVEVVPTHDPERAAAQQPVAEPEPEGEVVEAEIVEDDAVDGDAEVAKDPWDVPPTPAPAAEPAKPKRKTAKEKAAEKAAAEAAAAQQAPAAEEQDDSGFPPSINSGPAAPSDVTMAPAF